MQKIPKQEYTIEFKERTVEHVKEGKLIGLSAKELGLVEQTLRNWVKLSAAGKLTVIKQLHRRAAEFGFALLPQNSELTP